MPIRRRFVLAQPAHVPDSDRGCHPEMSFLYLVTKVAANAKYSINSFFSPVFDVTFREVENRAQKPLDVRSTKAQRPDSASEFSKENRARYFRFSRRRNIETIKV
jgi:hypothetical protein